MYVRKCFNLSEKNSSIIFNFIAPVYGLFYKFQKNHYSEIIDRTRKEIDISNFDRVIDIGCGTGALCSVLHENGMKVTGIDPAQKMLKIARKKSGNTEINFLEGNALDGLPFEDKTFDMAISSYVLHGLNSYDRKRIYLEMSRIAIQYVIIHDYNKKRSLLTSIVEWMERGDYFHFIKVAESEMKECMSDLGKCFSDVRVINVGERADWYICIPK